MTSSPSLGWAAISWIEHYLVHGPGDVQGQPIELDDEFAAFIVKAYRVNPKTGARVVRRAFLSRAKGRSKSGLAAFIEAFEALGPCRFDHWAESGEVSAWGYEYEPGEPVGKPLEYVEILNVATEEGQAGNTYDAVYYVLHADTCSDALLEDYGHLDVGLTRINLPNSRGFIEPVTASNESKDGGKSTYIVADETHLWIPPRSGKFKLGKMHQTMVRNLLKRKIASGWMLETSTMYGEGEGSVAEGTHQYAKALATAGQADGKLLFDHVQASEKWNLSKRSERLKALREAYGPAAAWMDLDAIADYWDDPQASEADFRRFFLNQPVPIEKPTLSVLPGWPNLLADHPGSPLAAIGLAVSIGGEWGSIAQADRYGDDMLNLDGQERRRGSAWLVGEAKRIQSEHGCRVVVDEKCPDATLLPALEAAGVEVTVMKIDGYVAAWSEITNRVREARVTHQANELLDEAVLAAKLREIGDGRKVPGRRASAGDIDMLEAACAATHGALNAPVEREPLGAFG
ncbi:hypothetical protein [Nocardioides stalactiti]|uniref:hypothetical protein n=1 Tax=Nocardioides stalactiti TaxID=2755356 RepID=UPI0015FF6BBF|nr:hypothetical protein [Nocardioides stalactiti]